MKVARQIHHLLALFSLPLLTGCGKPSQSATPPLAGPRITLPDTRPAQEALLPDGAKVVGVVVNGKARAYALRAMAPRLYHVVDDLVGVTPVTVTYCPKTGCVRTFTGSGSAPLPVVLEGYQDGLLLRCGNEVFKQATGRTLAGGLEGPVRQLPCEVTTWGKWNKAHPHSDVFEGG